MAIATIVAAAGFTAFVFVRTMRARAGMVTKIAMDSGTGTPTRA